MIISVVGLGNGFPNINVWHIANPPEIGFWINDVLERVESDAWFVQTQKMQEKMVSQKFHDSRPHVVE